MTLPHLPLHLTPVSYGHSLFSGLAIGSTLTLQALGHARFCAKALQLWQVISRWVRLKWERGARRPRPCPLRLQRPCDHQVPWQGGHMLKQLGCETTTPSTSLIFNLARTSVGTAGCRWRYVDPAKPQNFAAMNFIHKWHFAELRLQLWQSPNLPQRRGTMLHWPCEIRLERPWL